MVATRSSHADATRSSSARMSSEFPSALCMSRHPAASLASWASHQQPDLFILPVPLLMMCGRTLSWCRSDSIHGTWGVVSLEALLLAAGCDGEDWSGQSAALLHIPRDASTESATRSRGFPILLRGAKNLRGSATCHPTSISVPGTSPEPPSSMYTSLTCVGQEGSEKPQPAEPSSLAWRSLTSWTAQHYVPFTISRCSV